MSEPVGTTVVINGAVLLKAKEDRKCKVKELGKAECEVGE
jgi:hypothetical protein